MFAHYLIRYERDQKTYTVDELLNVLQLSSMLLVPDCRKKALDLLVGRFIPPAKRLQVAVDCCIVDWVWPAFKALVLGYDKITLADSVALGPTLFFTVSQARHAVTECRLHVSAEFAEYWPHSKCMTQDECATAFKHFGAQFVRHYHHPKVSLTPEAAMEWVRKEPRGAVCDHCWGLKLRMIDDITLADVGGGTQVSIFRMEEHVMQNAAKTILMAMAPFDVRSA